MSAMRSTLHRLRGFVASLEDGMGVNGVVQQPWIDEAYRLVDAALAELEAMERRAELTERVVEAARAWEATLSEWCDGPERSELLAALAELDGQTERDDRDCGGGLIYQPTRREMGVDAPDFGPIMGCCCDPGDCGETCA